MKTVLVVAQFEGVRNIIINNLEKKGFTVVAVENQKQAEPYFDGRTINLIICDCDTAEAESYVIIKNIRNNILYEFTPVIVISTKKKNDNIDKIQELKIGGWIQKPFDINEFEFLVGRYLK
jgi:two-component system chemotaxis response regulator CheY